MLKFIGIGHVARELELKTVKVKGTDTHVCEVNMGCNGGKDKNGNPITIFVRFSVWGSQADAWSKYVHKGTQVYVEGEPTIATYTKKDGTIGTSVELVRVSASEWLSKSTDSGSSGTAPTNYDKPVTPVATDDGSDDELPF